MIVRRRLIPGLVLLATATTLCAEASGQQPGPGQHEALPGTFTPDQIKRALQGFGGGGNLPNLPPDLLDFFKDRLEKQNKRPVDERQLKQALDMMQANPEFRRQVEEMGRNLKNNGGKNEITPEQRQQLERLLPDLQRAIPQNNGGIGQPPNVNPIPPKNLDLNPMPGQNPPPINNVPPRPIPQPLPGQNPDPLRKLDPDGRNPFDPNTTPREKAAQAAASLWERNIGPLDDTPAVKRALFELIEGSEDFTGPDGKSFWDDLALEEGDSTSLSDLLDDLSIAESWSMPKFELPEWKLFGKSDTDVDMDGGASSSRESWWSRNFGRRTTTQSSSAPSSGSGWNFNLGAPALQGSWLPVVLLAVLLFGGLLVWRFWGVKFGRNRAGLGLYGPGWPLDPRRITTREHVVIAFEYLSVLICGPSAKTWTHNTIAGALADLAATHGEIAVMLARLYELARYAPLNEPLSTAELAEARRLICALAGLEHE